MCVKVLHRLKACHILFGGQEYQINPSVENLDLSKYSTLFLIFSFPSPYFICKINNSRIHCICIQTYKKAGFSYTFTECFCFSFTIFLSSYLSYKIKWPLKINCSGLAGCFLFWESSSINWCSEISLTVTSLIAELNFFAPLLRGIIIKDSPWFVGESGSWIAIRKRLVSMKPAWVESHSNSDLIIHQENIRCNSSSVSFMGIVIFSSLERILGRTYFCHILSSYCGNDAEMNEVIWSSFCFKHQSSSLSAWSSFYDILLLPLLGIVNFRALGLHSAL